ncbi:MAG: hypothetical protein RLZZ188_791 [Verrucomicrobiota bacterium]
MNIVRMARRAPFRFPVSILVAAIMAIAGGAPLPTAATAGPAESLVRHVARFNAMEDEPVVNLVPNAAAAEWLTANIPLLECPDSEVEEIYYFRWWALRKHLRRPPAAAAGHVFTEFINRAEPVSSALGHHLMEGRWLRDARYHDDYLLWWLRGNAGAPQPRLHRYSQWLADAVLQRMRVTGDRAFAVGLLDDLVADQRQWEAEQRRADGLYWQFDVRDAMEESISGSRTRRHVRPTINSYMYGNARALAVLARIAGRPALGEHFEADAERLRALVVAALWNPDSAFFEVRRDDGALAGVREAIGFIPWYFHLPEPGRGHERAWAQLRDEAGFRAPFGLTTAERRHPGFRTHGTGTCEWDGAVWPFATSQTLTALANVLRDYPQEIVGRHDYLDAFLTYVRSHRMNGRPYIGEYLDERTGAWLKGDHPRSRWYHHSTFADLVIAGLAGLRPREDDVVEVHPLLPAETWSWFRVSAVRYHGRELEISWDRDGSRFGRGVGLQVRIDGRVVARSAALERVVGKLPAP